MEETGSGYRAAVTHFAPEDATPADRRRAADRYKKSARWAAEQARMREASPAPATTPAIALPPAQPAPPRPVGFSRPAPPPPPPDEELPDIASMDRVEFCRWHLNQLQADAHRARLKGHSQALATIQKQIPSSRRELDAALLEEERLRPAYTDEMTAAQISSELAVLARDLDVSDLEPFVQQYLKQTGTRLVMEG